MVTTVYSDLEKKLQTKQLVTKIKVDLLLTTQVVLQHQLPSELNADRLDETKVHTIRMQVT